MNVVEQSPGVGVLWSDSLRARIRPWTGDPTCGFLVMTTTGSAGPHSSDIQQWISTAQQWGYHRLRTSALPPTLTEPLHEAGFTEVQELTVLSVAHSDAPTFHVPRDVAPKPLRPMSRKRPSQKMLEVLHIDSLSFPAPWNMAWVDMNDAMRATEQSRLFVSRNKKDIDGFVLVGATQNTGFIQRLAVHPTARRTGVASRLVAASVEWSYRHGCSTTIVNTETSNTSALGLYESLGFQRMPDGLSVLERDL